VLHSVDIQHGHAAWVWACSGRMACSMSMDMQHWNEHAAWEWTCNMDMDMQNGHGHAAWTWVCCWTWVCSMDMACSMDMDMQSGCKHAACDMGLLLGGQRGIVAPLHAFYSSLSLTFTVLPTHRPPSRPRSHWAIADSWCISIRPCEIFCDLWRCLKA
jgi:hypothetical protein